MKNKLIIKIGISITLVLLVIYYFGNIFNFKIVDLIALDSNKKRIEVNSEYIKTGWMLKDTQNARLAIQPIDVFSLKIDTAKYEDFIENKTYTVDNCMTLFGKDNVDKIYFSKKSKGWTWDKICDLNTEIVIEKKREFEFNKNSYYRILFGYWRGNSSYKIFVYVDNNGNIKSFIKPRDGKSL